MSRERGISGYGSRGHSVCDSMVLACLDGWGDTPHVEDPLGPRGGQEVGKGGIAPARHPPPLLHGGRLKDPLRAWVEEEREAMQGHSAWGPGRDPGRATAWEAQKLAHTGQEGRRAEHARDGLMRVHGRIYVQAPGLGKVKDIVLQQGMRGQGRVTQDGEQTVESARSDVGRDIKEAQSTILEMDRCIINTHAVAFCARVVRDGGFVVQAKVAVQRRGLCDEGGGDR
jgi:hypothetical protein